MSIDYERLLLERLEEQRRDLEEQEAWLVEHGDVDDPRWLRVLSYVGGAGFALIAVWIAYWIASFYVETFR
jgi:hypothetical protein